MPKTVIERRLALSLSQLDMAVKLGVAISTWQRWEKVEPAPLWLDLALQTLERAASTQGAFTPGHASPTAPSPGRPATSSRALARESEIVRSFDTVDGHELSRDERHARVGDIVWAYGERSFGWFPAHLALGMPPVPLRNEPRPPVPNWLQPIMDACPVTRAYQARPTPSPPPAAQPSPFQFVNRGHVPDDILQQLAEVDAHPAMRDDA